MNSFAHSVSLLVAASCLSASAQSWQDVSSNVFCHAAIVWRVPSNTLPERMWVYRRILPRIFSATLISNAIVLRSLQSRGFPRPSTNDFFILKDEPANWPGVIPTLFGIIPGDAFLYGGADEMEAVTATEVPKDDAIKRRALACAPLLGLDPSQLTTCRFYSDTNEREDGTKYTRGRGVFFPRRLDGMPFFSADDDGEGAEGYSMEFGRAGKIQVFWVRWSEMKRSHQERTASQDEITHCLLAHKAIIMPNFQDGDFARLRSLAAVRRFVITAMQEYYSERIFLETPNDNAPCQFATPFAELEMVADFGSSNLPVKVLAPILSSEVRRVLHTN